MLSQVVLSAQRQVNTVFLRMDVGVDKEEIINTCMSTSGSQMQRAHSGFFLGLSIPGCCQSKCVPLTYTSVIKDRVHTAREKAQDARDDIVEVKNLSGRPQQYSPGS